jgi:RecA/RadA recombinase
VPKTAKSSSLIIPTARDINIISNIYAGIAGAIEKTQHIHTAEMEGRERLSTGVLVMDLMMNGGLLPTMIQISGPEQSAKTTFILHVLRSALLHRVPWVGLWDAEGTIVKNYADNILLDFDLNDLVSKIPKRVHYYRRNILEEVYDFLALFLQYLPDIVYHSSAGWVYQMPKSNAHFSKLMSNLGLQPDKKLSDNPNYWYCLGASGKPQGILMLDSYASLVTRAVDEQSKGANKRAPEAAEFSAGIKRVIGRISSKGFIILGTNQIRINPAPKYGTNPEYEPGGEALKFYSGVRFQSRSRSTPKEWEVDKQTYQAVEPSAFVEGATDRYSFKMFKNTKNKFDTPNLSAWVRIWTRDHNGVGHGICPVLDILEYARLTNQIVGNPTSKKGFKITIEPLSNIVFDLYTFKCMVLAEVFKDKPLWQWVSAKTGLTKPVMLQQRFFKQLASGETSKLIGSIVAPPIALEDLNETVGEGFEQHVVEI